MLLTEIEPAVHSRTSIFSKKPLLSIADLRLKPGATKHLIKNKLSDKLGRRGIKFYDLYRHHKEDKDVRALQAEGFKLDGIMEDEQDVPIYDDLEVEDFN